MAHRYRRRVGDRDAPTGGEWFDRLTVVVSRHPWAIVVAFAAACTLAGWTHARWARFEFSYRTMAPQSTPEFAEFEEFVEIFGDENDSFVIGFRDDPLITVANLEMIDRITRRIGDLEQTASIISLTNVLDIRGRDDALDVAEFVGPMPPRRAAMATLRERLTSDPIVAGALISRDATTAATVVRIAETRMTEEARAVYLARIESLLAEESAGRVEFYLAGYPYISDVVLGHMVADTALFMPMLLAVVGTFLWLVFGRLRAVWMPIIPVLIAAILTLGVLSGLGLPMSLLTGEAVLGTLILVIGLADGVHLLSRYDENLRTDPYQDRERVLRVTLRQVGRACFLTSLTTAIGFLSLALADVPSVRDFGIFGALGICFAFVGAIVLLPALIVLTERRRMSAPRETTTAAWLDRALEATASIVIRRPRTIVAAGVVLLCAAAASIPGARVDNRPTRDLKPADPAVLALDFLEDNLGGAYPLDIVVRGGAPDALKNPALLAEVDRIRAGIEKLPFVSKVSTPVEFIKKMNRAMNADRPADYRLPSTSDAVAQYLLLFEMAGGDGEFSRLVNYDYSVARMTAIIKDVPSEVYWSIVDELERIEGGRLPPGVDIRVSGEGPIWRSAAPVLISTLVRSLYLAMPLIFLVTALAFRSVRLGLISILPNLLPLTIGLGLLWPLGISLRFSTITAFPIAFGLAVDDTIHFLNRYRSESAAGKTREQAVRATIMTTGQPILLTSVLLIAGFSVLLLSNFLGMVHVAVLDCIILTMALFGDLLLLPALLLLFGPDGDEPLR